MEMRPKPPGCFRRSPAAVTDRWLFQVNVNLARAVAVTERHPVSPENTSMPHSHCHMTTEVGSFGVDL